MSRASTPFPVEELMSVVESSDVAGATRFIKARYEEPERIAAFETARSTLTSHDWPGKSLLKVAEFTQGVIDEALRLAEFATLERGQALKQYANATCYNLSADLADCWPDDPDPTPKEEVHFRLGLAAAESCLQLRHELGRPLRAFSMAYFIKGVHEFSLGMHDAAHDSFSRKLDYDFQALGEQTSISPATHEDILLSHGLIALVRWTRGESGAQQAYEATIDALERRAHDAPQLRENIELYTGELRTMNAKHGVKE